jgi:hypothetical protein
VYGSVAVMSDKGTLAFQSKVGRIDVSFSIDDESSNHTSQFPSSMKIINTLHNPWH